MSNAEQPEFAKQSLKGLMMRIVMMIELFRREKDD